MDLFAIVCPQCGSNDVSVSEKSNDAVCNSCGTKFLITDKQPNWYEENAVYEPAKRADRKLKFKPLYSTDVFVRKVIVDLFQKGANMELLAGVIAPVKTSWRRMLSERAIADVDYSGSVGYHRTEKYIAIEEKYDKDKQKTIKVPVERERFVTDWQQASGKNRVVSLAAFIENESDYSVDEERNFMSAFQYANADIMEEDIEDDGSLIPEAQQRLQDKHQNNFRYETEKLVNADDTSRLTVRVEQSLRIDTSQWKTPVYETQVSQGNTVLKRYGFPICNGEICGDEINKRLRQQDIKQQVKKGTGLLFLISALTSIGAIIAISSKGLPYLLTGQLSLLDALFRVPQNPIVTLIAMAAAMTGYMVFRIKLSGKIVSEFKKYEKKE